MLTETSCGAVVFTRKNTDILYLIIESTEGFFGFPKGHMEDGESETETALREIKEETGVDSAILEGFRTTDAHPHVREGRPTVMKEMVYFLAEYEDQAPVPQEGEVNSLKLMTYNEAMAAFQFESSRRILTEANDFLTSK